MVARIASADVRELRKFGLTVGGVFAAIALVLAYRSRFGPLFYVAACAGGPLLVLGAVWPSALRLAHRWWMRFAALLSWFNTRLILGVVFFALFAPIALVRRIFGIDPLARRVRRGAESYWHTRPVEAVDPDRYRKPF